VRPTRLLGSKCSQQRLWILRHCSGRKHWWRRRPCLQLLWPLQKRDHNFLIYQTLGSSVGG